MGKHPDHLSEIISRDDKFIHDIATPLAVAQGMLDIALTKLGEDLDSDMGQRLQKVLKAIVTLRILFEQQRKFLTEIKKKI